MLNILQGFERELAARQAPFDRLCNNGEQLIANGHSRGLKKRIKGLRDDWTRFRSNDARASKTLLSRTRLTWQTFPPPQQQLRQVHYSDALEHSIILPTKSPSSKNRFLCAAENRPRS